MTRLYRWLVRDVQTNNTNLVAGVLVAAWLFGCIGYGVRVLTEGR